MKEFLFESFSGKYSFFLVDRGNNVKTLLVRFDGKEYQAGSKKFTPETEVEDLEELIDLAITNYNIPMNDIYSVGHR